MLRNHPHLKSGSNLPMVGWLPDFRSYGFLAYNQNGIMMMGKKTRFNESKKYIKAS
jgi:hypothetical protein